MSNLSKIPELTLVYGGQFGSEGKGQVLAAIVRDDRKSHGPGGFIAVRVGGPNAGHTVRGASGEFLKVQSIPVPAFIFPECAPVIGAGGLVNREVLFRELALLKEERFLMEYTKYDPAYILLDDMAMVVTEEDISTESLIRLQKSIGSTCEGVGAALARKIQRHDVKVALDYDDWPIGVRVVDTVRFLNHASIPVYIEGTQGHKLSLHTSGYFPFCTSRECGPEGILADIGITTRSAYKVELVCVLRTFPIRVGGNSGDLKYEVDWDYMREHCAVKTPERTTVTNRVRRIANWDMAGVVQTIRETRPTCLAISFIDYLFPCDAGVTKQLDLSYGALSWLNWVQRETGTVVKYASTGAGQELTFKVNV